MVATGFVKRMLALSRMGQKVALPPDRYLKLVRSSRIQRSKLAEWPVQVPLDMCVGYTGFPFDPKHWHYLSTVLREFDANPDLQPEGSYLERFHQRFQPSDSAHLLDALGVRVAYRPALGMLPWGGFRRGTEKEGLSGKVWSHSRWYGPTPPEIIRDEFERMVAAYRSIKRDGYLPWERGFLGGTFLRRADGALRFIVLQGNHRAAVLAHLGHTSVLVRCLPGCHCVIDESDASQWWSVRSGQCGVADARAYLQAYFLSTGREQARRFGLLD